MSRGGNNLKKFNIHKIIDSPGTPLFFTFIAFFVSAYCTYIVFTSDTVTTIDYIIGIMKTILLEGCKLLFYAEIKKDNTSKKINMYLVLWIFFLTMSLLHTMNYEVSKINKEENKNNSYQNILVEENKTLTQLRKDKINKQKQIDNILSEKENSLSELQKNKEIVIKDSNNTIKDTSNNMQTQINSYSNKFRTAKNQKISEKNNKIKNITNDKNNKISEISEKYTKESSRYDNSIKIINLEMDRIDKDIKNITLNIKNITDKNNIKIDSGLSPIINLILSIKDNVNKFILTFGLILLMAIALDLAGCKCYQMYISKLEQEIPILDKIRTTAQEILSKKDDGIVAENKNNIMLENHINTDKQQNKNINNDNNNILNEKVAKTQISSSPLKTKHGFIKIDGVSEADIRLYIKTGFVV